MAALLVKLPLGVPLSSSTLSTLTSQSLSQHHHEKVVLHRWPPSLHPLTLHHLHLQSHSSVLHHARKAWNTCSSLHRWPPSLHPLTLHHLHLLFSSSPCAKSMEHLIFSSSPCSKFQKAWLFTVRDAQLFSIFTMREKHGILTLHHA